MNSNEIRELELIEKIKLQDSEALKQLCNIYQPLIRSISNNYFCGFMIIKIGSKKP